MKIKYKIQKIKRKHKTSGVTQNLSSSESRRRRLEKSEKLKVIEKEKKNVLIGENSLSVISTSDSVKSSQGSSYKESGNDTMKSPFWFEPISEYTEIPSVRFILDEDLSEPENTSEESDDKEYFQEHPRA